MRQWDSKLLEKLLVIQDIDLKIRGVADTVKELQQRCMREDPELNMLKAEQQAISDSLESTKAQKEMYQNTLEDIRSAIKGLIANRARAFKPRNRSSTEALRTEEEKLSILVVETDEQIEILEKNFRSIQGRIELRAMEVQRSQQAPEAKIEIHNNQILDLEKERTSHLGGLPISLLKKYERLRASRSGVGLTILRDGICRVCRMEMPTGIKSKLLKDEPIDSCPACGRMVARIENTVDHKKLAEEARAAQEKKMREEEEAAVRAEAKAKKEAAAAKRAEARARKAAEKQALAEKEAAIIAKKEAGERAQAEKEAAAKAKKEASAAKRAEAKAKKALEKQALADKESGKTKKATSKKTASKKAESKKVTAKKSDTDTTSTLKAASKSSTKKVTSKAATSKKAAGKNPAKKTAAKKSTSKKSSTKKEETGKASEKKATAKKKSKK